MPDTGLTRWHYPPGLAVPRKCVVLGPEAHPDGSQTGKVGVDFCRGCQRLVTIVDPKHLYTREGGAYEAMSDYYYDLREAERQSQLGESP